LNNIKLKIENNRKIKKRTRLKKNRNLLIEIIFDKTESTTLPKGRKR